MEILKIIGQVAFFLIIFVSAMAGIIWVAKRFGKEVKWSEALRDIVSTKPGVVVLGIIVFIVVLKINWPENYAEAFGGEKWWHLLALLISTPVAVALFERGGGVCTIAGFFIALVGLSPVATSFPFGKIVARTYNDGMDYIQHGARFKTLKIAEWIEIMHPKDVNTPNIIRPAKGCFVIRNIRKDGQNDFWAVVPEGDPRKIVVVDNKTITVVDDMSKMTVNWLHGKPCDSNGPDRLYYKYEK